jgi:hypothetical protein
MLDAKKPKKLEKSLNLNGKNLVRNWKGREKEEKSTSAPPGRRSPDGQIQLIMSRSHQDSHW